MSNKFTGITSGGQEIPVYDKAALHDAYSAGNNISINDNVIAVTGRKSLAVQSPLSAEVSGNNVIISLDESALDVSSKLDTSAFAEVSGSFLTSGDLDGYATQEWVGEQGYLTEVPESAVSGFATHEEVESATSGKADTSALSGYLPTASAYDLFVRNSPYEVTAGPTNGSGGDPIFRANPGGLYVGNNGGYKVLSATDRSFTVGDPNYMLLSANQDGFHYSGQAAEISAYGNFSVKVPGNVRISAGMNFSAVAPYSFSVSGSTAGNGYAISADSNELNYTTSGKNSDDEEIEKSRFTVKSGIAYSSYNGPRLSATNNGISFSSNNSAFGSAVLTTAQGNSIVQMCSPKFEAKNVSGAGFSIEASGARGYDHNGNVIWDTSKPAKLIGWNNYKGTAIDPRADGINGGIIATVYPDNIPLSMQLSAAPYTYMNGYGFYAVNNSYGASLSLDTSQSKISLEYTGTSSTATMDPGDVSYKKYNSTTSATDTWSLTGSVQKREIECDSATSAITAIAGSAIGGGGEVPEGVMVESAVGFNAVNEISGYNGSAIAQYGAEKQWLVHDDTLVHAANSAQYALGCNISALQRLMGIDETVLFNAVSTHGVTGDVTLSESRDNFDHVRIIYRQNDGHNECKEVYNVDQNNKLTLNSFTLFQDFPINKISKYTISGNQITLLDGGEYTTTGWSTNKCIFILQVIGIGRKQ